MLIRAEDLPRDVDQLIRIVLAQAAEIEKYETALKTVQAMVFGARSERGAVILENQLSLGLGDGVEIPPADEEVVGPKAGAAGAAKTCAPRAKARRNRGFLPKHLERVERTLEPETAVCSCCNGALHKIGEDVSEALDVIPAILRVLRTIRPRYGCRACEGAPVQAPAEERVMDGGMATTAMIVSIAVWKFAWHMPLSRQAKMLAGQGVTLDRATLGKWMKRLAWWLEPLYRRQMAVMHAFPRLFCDETRMPVRRDDSKTCHVGQFWTHATDDRPWGGPAPPAVAYVYAEGRGHKEIKAQLADFSGLLQVDGYAGYNGLAVAGRRAGPIQLAFCLAHARRKFVELYKVTKSPFAAEVIGKLAEVYAIEDQSRGNSADHRRRVREAQTAPLMADLKTMLEAALAKVSKTSAAAKAIRYSLGHWKGLTLFLEDGRLEVDSNTVERTIRPIALGRRNHMFAGDDGGAETWAILASLLQTARLNDLDPSAYLLDVVEKIVTGKVKVTKLDRLLAWNWKAERAPQDQAMAA
jgi:transposase